MRILHRPYDDQRDDFNKLWKFLQEDYAIRKDDAPWLTSRLSDWKFGLWSDQKLIPSFFREYAHVWTDSFDEVMGFVLSEDGGDGFFIFTRNAYDWLYGEILDWTILNWGGRQHSLKTEIHMRQMVALDELAQRGFVNTSQACVRRTYDLRAIKEQPVDLPDGYRIVSMAENGNFLGKARLFVNSFGEYDEPTPLDLLKFAYSRENPIYDPAFDLSVITADGVHCSTCVGFNDPSNSVAEVEKVCTHSRYRKLGLAEAVIRECFNRLKKRGIQTAYITGYSHEANNLYEKLGPCARLKWYYLERKM